MATTSKRALSRISNLSDHLLKLSVYAHRIHSDLRKERAPEGWVKAAGDAAEAIDRVEEELSKVVEGR